MVVELVILALINESLGQINKKNVSQMEGGITEYLPVDTLLGKVTSYPVEFFNSLELSEVPSDKLRLKVGVSVILIRNLYVPRLLTVTNCTPRSKRRESVLISRIPIIPKDLPSQFKR
ncbi:hypothetical protein AVEN_142392-1 [Araneus ventricosus]|uniref:DNA helicase Pif1-like 2B domain-containing protein n=1 Tax=Araneus ventricosus TaxID=182803 RepID=A0A4Y2FIP5_ARAVE|nr:hypothetical protein AVEN_142392-1 [Araneus ventricosus]